jgi:hypothetical protein
MKQLAKIRAETVLQLLVVQQDVAVPDIGVPVLAGVHVVPNGTHVYVSVAMPAAHTEVVFNKLKL